MLVGKSTLKSIYLSSLAAFAMAAGPQVGLAADLGGNCCADLEERIAELEATTVRKGNRKVSLTVSGTVNEAIMFWDDGSQSDAYIVTNETKRTRLNFSGKAKITDDVSAGYVMELGPRGDRMDRKDQSNTHGAGSFAVDVRYSYWLLKSNTLGQVSVGLQPQAYDTITETTVANTGHFARPGPGQQFGDSGRGYFLRRPNGTLSTLRWGNISTQGVNGTPGEGHRVDVVRYDTPAMAGFTASASWGDDDVWDLAVRYAGELSGFKMAFGAGYAQWTADDPRGCAKFSASSSTVDCSEIGLSGSIMHLATGLFATGAYGYRKDDKVRALYGNVTGIEDQQSFYFVQAGIEQKWLPLGKTTIFGEYWHEASGPGLTNTGGKLNALPLGAGARISNADLSLWGVGLNQTLADGVDMYISYRHADADVFTSANGSKIGSAKTTVEPFQYVTVGTQIKF
jgi:Gram-negative porin